MKSISLLTTNDLAQALVIEQRSHLFPWSAKTLASNQGDRYVNYRCDVAGVMAAFAITHVVLDEATLFNIAVDPDWQRTGVGYALLSHVINVLQQRDVLALWLEVRASNQAAMALYQRLGFNEVSLRRHYYPALDGGREDAIIMALTL